MREEQNNTNEEQPTESTVVKMTAEEFVNKFHKDINYAAETEMNEDKEGDYEHRGIGAYLALKFAASEHVEIEVTDLREVLAELKQDESHPVCELIYSEPIEEETEVVKAPKQKKKVKKSKSVKKTKKVKKAKAPKVKLTPLGEMSYDDFEKLLEEKGEEGVFEMYADEIQEYGEWIWREQDRGGLTYDLESCIKMAKQELMDGIWGPRAE